MRGSEFLRPAYDKYRHWETAHGMHIARMTWEYVDPKEHGGCPIRIKWILKPNEMDPSGGKVFDKTFLVDLDRNDTSAGLEVTEMMQTRGIK